MKTYDYTKLKTLREKQEPVLTQKNIADRLGITQSAYNKLETGNRKRKTDSIMDIEKLAEAFRLTPPRLISILTNEEDAVASGVKEADLWQTRKVLKKEPLREDEFIFFTTQLLDPDKYDFKKDFKRMELLDDDELDNFPMGEYPPGIMMIQADSVEIGFEFEKKILKYVSIWLGKKQLGVIPSHYNDLVYELIHHLMISRVICVGNDEEVIPGFVDHYNKLIFIASNAVCKSSEFKKGRFTKIRLMTKEEVAASEEEEMGLNEG